MNREKPLVFVSCGMHTPAERELGNAICELIRDSRPDLEPYFAQNESTVDGLSHNILGKLHQAAGFVCVMHQRGVVRWDDQLVAVRGSVWIEQEIAIVTFMQHLLHRRIPVLFYVQKGVSMEGVRTVLQLNPRAEFTDESEVLQDLRNSLPDMRMEVHFPNRFVEGASSNFAAVDAKNNTKAHFCFVADQTRLRGKPLYSGQKMSPELTIPYHVDHYLADNALGDIIYVNLYSGDMRPVRREYEVRKFQKF